MFHTDFDENKEYDFQNFHQIEFKNIEVITKFKFCNSLFFSLKISIKKY